MPTIILPQKYTAKVVKKEQISPKVRWVQLTTDRPIDFAPGQYASFLINNNRRLLSFASLPTDLLIDFVVDISPGGVASQYVLNLKPGDTVQMLAPYGRFIVQTNHQRPYLFIATGAGIAPIRSQLKAILGRPATLIFGNHSEEYLLFADEWQELAEQLANFTFIPVLSEPSAAWAGERGLVTEAAPRQIPNLAEHDVYVCGSPAMIKDMLAVLAAHQVPLEHIHAEQFR